MEMRRGGREVEWGDEVKTGFTGAELKNCNVVAIRKWEVVCFVVVGAIPNRGFAIRELVLVGRRGFGE
jgi:hypothetical protein